MKPGVSDALVCQVDFAASFAALTGQQFDSKTSPDSQNMLPALLGESETGRTQLVEHSHGLALRAGNWKFIEAHPGPARNQDTGAEHGNSPQPQLYDLSTDLGEKNNVASVHPEKVAEMRTILESERAKAGDASAPDVGKKKGK